MKSTKIVAGALLALTMVCGIFTACNKDSKNNTVGVLSFLNRSEEDHAQAFWARRQTVNLLVEQGYCTAATPSDKRPVAPKVKYYDTLDALLMALKAGEIFGIEGLPQSTAKYLCSKDPALQLEIEFDMRKERPYGSFAEEAINILSDSFSFMLLKSNADLCNQFSAVIAELDLNGEMKSLISSHILGQMDGSEIKPLAIENIPGRDTIKVAVTGALPPMDYVASDGTFAGFNTALLGLIGKKLDKNIEIVQVSSVARASALASGTVDVVFWTRGSAHLDYAVALKNEGEIEKFREERKAVHTREENDAMDSLVSGQPFETYANRDMPEGTIITIPYFVDMPVLVTLKK